MPSTNCIISEVAVTAVLTTTLIDLYVSMEKPRGYSFYDGFDTKFDQNSRMFEKKEVDI